MPWFLQCLYLGMSMSQFLSLILIHKRNKARSCKEMAPTSGMQTMFSISRKAYPFSRKIYVSIGLFRILKAKVSDAYEYNPV